MAISQTSNLLIRHVQSLHFFYEKKKYGSKKCAQALKNGHIFCCAHRHRFSYALMHLSSLSAPAQHSGLSFISYPKGCWMSQNCSSDLFIMADFTQCVSSSFWVYFKVNRCGYPFSSPLGAVSFSPKSTISMPALQVVLGQLISKLLLLKEMSSFAEKKDKTFSTLKR